MASTSPSPPPLSAFSAIATQRHHPLLPLLSNAKRPITRILVSSPPNNPTTTPTPTRNPPPSSSSERVFFDGGARYGDLVTNLLLGFTLFWLPLTIAAVSRAFFLRYRFNDLRVTVVSGFTGQDRSDFPYRSIQDVQVVPRFIGEWGDIVITLKDGTKIDLRSVPKFREIADYCLFMAEKGKDGDVGRESSAPRGFRCLMASDTSCFFFWDFFPPSSSLI